MSISINSNSAFSSGVMGLQKATAQIDANASKIAQQSLPIAGESQSSGATDVIPDSLVQLKSAELQGKASTEVIKRSDQMLGSILDIHV